MEGGRTHHRLLITDEQRVRLCFDLRVCYERRAVTRFGLKLGSAVRFDSCLGTSFTLLDGNGPLPLLACFTVNVRCDPDLLALRKGSPTCIAVHVS